MMQRSASRNRNQYLQAFLGLSAGFLALLAFAILSYQYGIKTTKWPKATGTVAKVEVTSIDAKGEDPRNYPRIILSYEVAGQNLSTTIHTTLEEALNYKEGSEITVHYDPEIPSSVILKPGVPLLGIILASVIAFGLLIGAVIYLMLLIWPESESDKSLQLGDFSLFGRFSIGWDLAQSALNILRLDPEMLVFPMLSGLSCLIVLASFLVPLWNSESLKVLSDAQNTRVGLIHYLLLFAFYFANYFVMTFFNAALIACAVIRFNGGDPTVGTGLRFAILRLPQILAWALVSSTVGIILRSLESTNKFIVQLTSGLLGFAWTVASYFVLPIIVVEKMGPIAAVQKSTQIIRDNWGEAIGAHFGLGFINIIAYLICLIPISLGLLITGKMALLIGFSLTIVLLLVVSVISTALDAILLGALYLYASQGKTLPMFDETYFETAFRCSEE